MLTAEGKSFKEIIELAGKSRPIVNKWRKCFRKHRLKSLKDVPRSGKPRKIILEQRVLVIEKACTRPEGGYTNWSQGRIANEIGISQSRVHQIFKKANLKLHKVEYWYGKSKDPEFEEKMDVAIEFHL